MARLSTKIGLTWVLLSLGAGVAASGSPGLAPGSAASAAFEREVNALRERHGRRSLQPLPPAVRQVAQGYADAAMGQALDGGHCEHDPALWRGLEARSASGFGLVNSGEVVACSLGESALAPGEITARWQDSDRLRAILLERPRLTHLSCFVAERSRGAMVLCITWTPSAAAGSR